MWRSLLKAPKDVAIHSSDGSEGAIDRVFVVFAEASRSPTNARRKDQNRRSIYEAWRARVWKATSEGSPMIDPRALQVSDGK